jgi:N-acetylmuramoyl-L-alanine amidase
LNLENNGEHIFVLGPPNLDRKIATNMPGALTETLFISNDTEATLLADTKVINAIARGYSEAIESYFS